MRTDHSGENNAWRPIHETECRYAKMLASAVSWHPAMCTQMSIIVRCLSDVLQSSQVALKHADAGGTKVAWPVAQTRAIITTDQHHDCCISMTTKTIACERLSQVKKKSKLAQANERVGSGLLLSMPSLTLVSSNRGPRKACSAGHSQDNERGGWSTLRVVGS